MLSQTLGPRVAKILIDPDTVIEDMEPGYWFIVEYDKETVSIVHLSLNDETDVSAVNGCASAYRILTFFTFGISDVSRPLGYVCAAIARAKKTDNALTFPY